MKHITEKSVDELVFDEDNKPWHYGWSYGGPKVGVCKQLPPTESDLQLVRDSYLREGVRPKVFCVVCLEIMTGEL